jgi:hypothetical protein
MEIYPNGGYNTAWWGSQQCQQQELQALGDGMNNPENGKVQQETKNVYNSY